MKQNYNLNSLVLSAIGSDFIMAAMQPGVALFYPSCARSQRNRKILNYGREIAKLRLEALKTTEKEALPTPRSPSLQGGSLQLPLHTDIGFMVEGGYLGTYLLHASVLGGRIDTPMQELFRAPEKQEVFRAPLEPLGENVAGYGAPASHFARARLFAFSGF